MEEDEKMKEEREGEDYHKQEGKKSSKKVLFIVVGILILLLILFFVYKTRGENEKEHKENSFPTQEVEVYKSMMLSELLKVDSRKLEKDFFIDTTKVGKTNISYSYYDDEGRKQKGTFELNVVDKTPPYCNLSKMYTYTMGTEFNLIESVFCGDNVTRHPSSEIVGDYDLTKEGEYPLVFRVEDESHNVKETEFLLKVAPKNPNVSTSRTNRLSLEEMKKRLPSGATFMIDVSKWQGDIDWKQVSQSGIQYVMLRLGTQTQIGGDSVLDSYFEQNIKNAKANGLKVGVYYYSYATSKKEALEQAHWVTEQLEPYQLDLPVAFDWECFGLYHSMDLNFYELNEIAREFFSLLEEKNYSVLLYGSKNYLENVWTYLEKTPVWLAHYTEETTYREEYVMWQFTNVGEIPGIKGNVDVNFYYPKS